MMKLFNNLQMNNFWLVIFTVCTVASVGSFVGLWINSDEQWLRGDLEFLSNRRIINSPITTWPVIWSYIKHDIDGAEGRHSIALNNKSLHSLSVVYNNTYKQSEYSVYFDYYSAIFDDFQRITDNVNVGVIWKRFF